MQVCIKQIEAGKPLSAVVCYLKVSSTIKWKKKEELSNRLTAAKLKDFPLENIECNKYQLIFVIAEEVLSQPFPFRLKKNNGLIVSLIASTCICFCRKTGPPVSS